MFESIMTILKYFWAKIYITIPITFFIFSTDQWEVIWGLGLVIAVDTFLGLWVAIKHKVFASYKLRRITDKIIKYACLLFLMHIIGEVEFTMFGWAFKSMGVFLILTEIFSCLEKLSILGVELPTKILAMLNKDFKDYYFGDSKKSEQALKRILNKEQGCKNDIKIKVLNNNLKV